MVKRNKKGFVLLFTLVTIGLASFVLIKLANHRLQLLAVSNEKLEDLQLRWGSLTLRRSVAYTQMSQQDRGRKFSIPLGNLTYEIRSDAESTKLNLNSLWLKAGRENLVSISAAAMNEGSEYVRFRPSGSGSQSFSSWGDVFSMADLQEQPGSNEVLLELSRQITCWGNGRLHYLETPDRIFELLVPVIGFDSVTKFLDERRLDPNLSLSELMEQLELAADEQQLLQSWLTDRHDTQSIWMLTKSNRNQRLLQTEFVVASRSTNGSIELSTFQW